MRIAIVGAGAVGCYLASRFSDAGHTITLVGHPDQVAAVRRDGLLVNWRDGSSRHYHIPIAEALTERPELVLLTVKTQDVTAACEQIAPHVDGVPVLTMQNGVRSDRLAADVLGEVNIVGAVIICAATYLQPGEISVEFPGWLVVGEPFGAERPRTRAIVQVLNSAISTYMTHDLAATRWTKLIANLNNALCAATGLTLPDVMAVPGARSLPVRVMHEGYRVAHAAGKRLDHGLYGLTRQALQRDRSAAMVAVLQATMTGMLAVLPERAAVALSAAAGRSSLGRLPLRFSTWQSIMRGRPSEIDYLNGEIVRLGRHLHIPTPLNSRLVDAVYEVERTHKFVPVAALIEPSSQPFEPRHLAGGAAGGAL